MRTIDKLLFILILIVVVLLCIMIYRYDKEANECMENSMQYAINKLAEVNVANITCICMSDNPETEAGIFSSSQK